MKKYWRSSKDGIAPNTPLTEAQFNKLSAKKKGLYFVFMQERQEMIQAENADPEFGWMPPWEKWEKWICPRDKEKAQVVEEYLYWLERNKEKAQAVEKYLHWLKLQYNPPQQNLIGFRLDTQQISCIMALDDTNILGDTKYIGII